MEALWRAELEAQRCPSLEVLKNKHLERLWKFPPPSLPIRLCMQVPGSTATIKAHHKLDF